MWIRLKKNEHRLLLLLPTALLLNRFAAAIGCLFAKEQGIRIDKKQAVAFVKALNRYRRQHRDWELVEVQDADGTYVKVKL